MNYYEVIISGVLLGLAVAISVGPTLFAVIRYSMQHTFRAGLAFVIGVSLSDIFYVLAANFAASTWVDALKSYQFYIGVVGSILFMGMGLFSFFKKYKPRRPKRNEAATLPTSMYWGVGLSGFFMNTLNPVVFLIWVGASLQVAAYSTFEKVLFFSVCLLLILAIDFCKVFLAEKIRSWLTLRKIMYFNKISAAIIFVFGFVLLINILLGKGVTN